MDSTNNTSSSDLRTRLIAFLIVLAVGFVMGWFRSSPVEPTSQLAATAETTDADQEEAAQQEPQQEASLEQAAPSASATPAQPTDEQDDDGSATVAPTRGPTVERDGWYTTKEEVALYIHTYGRLPGNFISKTKARDRGWVASEGNLDEVCPGMSIGGSRFYNDEGQLPDARGRQWTECDINYHGGYRGAERIVFSNDGLVYYTSDHYKTFEQLY